MVGIDVKDFTIDKLRFSSLGRLYGREPEAAQFKAVIANQMGQLKKFEEQQRLKKEKEDRVELPNKDSKTLLEEVKAGHREKHNNNNEESLKQPTTHKPGFHSGSLRAIQESEELLGGSSDEDNEEDDDDNDNPKKNLVCVSGNAGSGKSVLAMETLPLVREHRGFFLSGKFHWDANRARPLEAIANAFDSLCEDLALYKSQQAMPEMGYNRWLFSFQSLQKQLLEIFDTEELQLLHRIIPHLGTVVDIPTVKLHQEEATAQEGRSGSSDNNNSSEYVGSELRLRSAFKRLVNLICSFGPLVLVLDDCQWMDRPSLELVQSLIQDDETPPITIIVNYRPNEVDDEHMFQKAISALEDDRAAVPVLVHRMQARNLEVDDICGLLEDLIDMTPDKTRPLAECIKSKTGGNALHVREFLLSLHRDELLTFEFRLMHWEWDVEEIKVCARVTENVVGLINDKIKELPPVFSRLLPQIACLGCRFSIAAFEVVVDDCVSGEEVKEAEAYLLSMSHEKKEDGEASRDEKGSEEATRSPSQTILSVCEQIGLVTRCGENSRFHQWEHDKIQEAALSFVPEDESLAFQFEVGKLLLNKLSKEHLSEVLFVVTSLFNSNTESLSAQDDLRIQIADLNCRSSVSAFYSSAFESAADFARKGIALLPTDKFDSHYDLALDLYEIAAEAHFSNGDFHRAMTYTNEVIALDIPLLHKRRVYKAELLSLAGVGRVAEAKDLCLEVLKMLGCRFPKRMKSVHILAGVVKLLSTVESMSKKIEKLKVIEDERKVWVLDLLDRLVTYSYQAGDPDLLSLTMMKGLSLTAKWGISEKSGPLLASGGLLLVLLGNYAGAKKFADLAMKYANTSTEARIRMISYRHVLHYQVSFPTFKKALIDGYRCGLRAGDLESALWCIYGFCDDQLATGAKLPIVIKDFEMYARQAFRYNHVMIVRCFKIAWQFCLNLVKQGSAKDILCGEIMNEAEMIAELEADKSDGQTIYNLKRFKIHGCFWFRDYEEAVRIIETMGFHKKTFQDNIPGLSCTACLYVHCALSCISVARIKEDKKKNMLKMSKFFLAYLKEMNTKGNPNTQHFLPLIEAELLTFKPDDGSAKKKFESSIQISGRLGLIQEQAIAHERLGDHCLRLGYQNDARYHFDCALELLKYWSADARADLLASELLDVAPAKEIITQKHDAEDDASTLSIFTHD